MARRLQRRATPSAAMPVVAEAAARAMSRRPAITSLLNGQAVKVAFGSTSVTSRRGSSASRRARAGRAGEAAADHDDPRRRRLRRARASAAAAAAAPAPPRFREVAPRAVRRCVAARLHFCAAYHAAIAAISSSEKPLAIRSITVAGRLPARNASIAATISPASRPASTRHRRLTARLPHDSPSTTRRAGRRVGRSGTAPASDQRSTAISATHGTGSAARRQARFRSWFISGSERMRLPVAAKIALSTAGAATAIVGSPTPPQKPPDGTMIVSTFGISSMRITW